jgi:hypothetical protein
MLTALDSLRFAGAIPPAGEVAPRLIFDPAHRAVTLTGALEPDRPA